VQLISKVVSAGSSSVAVVDCEERAPRPLVDLFELWLDDVKNDADSILVIVPNDALVSVGRVAAHHSILFAGKFGRMVRVDESVNLLLLHFHVLLLLLCCHYKATVGHQLVLRFRLVHATLVL